MDTPAACWIMSVVAALKPCVKNTERAPANTAAALSSVGTRGAGAFAAAARRIDATGGRLRGVALNRLSLSCDRAAMLGQDRSVHINTT